MMRNTIFAAGLATVALVPTACQDTRSQPTAPSSVMRPSFGRELEDADDDDGAGFLKLVSPIGPGRGVLRPTRVPHPTVPGNFAIHIEVRIRHAKPNTAYLVQRSPEAFGPPGPPAGFDVATLTDGSCQLGLAIAPWSTRPAPTPASFVSFPDQAHGLATLIMTTDAEGNGAADFVYAIAFPLPLFDVMFRVLENSPAPTSALVSECTNLPLLP